MKGYSIILGLLALTACSDNTPENPEDGGDSGEIVSVEKSVTIDAGQTFQKWWDLVHLIAGRLRILESIGPVAVTVFLNFCFLRRL